MTGTMAVELKLEGGIEGRHRFLERPFPIDDRSPPSSSSTSRSTSTWRLHFVEVVPTRLDPQRPVVILCHGWPDIWFTWRHQIRALSSAGYRVIAPDMRGFGQSVGPHAVSSFTQQAVCGDLIALLDFLALSSAVFVGHDWGGAIVWSMALHYPERVRAVGALNTPFFPPSPKNPMEDLTKNPRAFDYQLYFQEQGRAEAELEKDTEYTLRCIVRGSSAEETATLRATGRKLSTENVRERGGLLVGYPSKDVLPRSALFNEEEFAYFVQQFRNSGFRGGLNWYRNHETNWKWKLPLVGTQVRLQMPCLMVTAGKDSVLTPAAAKAMDQYIPRLSRHHIENCGHWTQLEHPEEVSRVLLDWLQQSVLGSDSVESGKKAARL